MLSINMMAENQNSGTGKDIHCYAIASKHVSTATKTHSHVNNTQAIARKNPRNTSINSRGIHESSVFLCVVCAKDTSCIDSQS
jgi:hypothetical protein